MPQMFPMNWFLFSLVFLLLMTFSSQNNNYSTVSSMSKDKIFMKNVKWMW